MRPPKSFTSFAIERAETTALSCWLSVVALNPTESWSCVFAELIDGVDILLWKSVRRMFNNPAQLMMLNTYGIIMLQQPHFCVWVIVLVYTCVWRIMPVLVCLTVVVFVESVHHCCVFLLHINYLPLCIDWFACALVPSFYLHFTCYKLFNDGIPTWSVGS